MPNQALPTLSEESFASLIRNRVPLLDVRAEAEFAKGAIDTAINLPILNDDERAQVGTCYKHSGQEAAINLGNKLVRGEVKDQRVCGWRDLLKRRPETVLYCARGGLRSKISQQWLSDAGVEVPRVTGGYKMLRRLLLETLAQSPQRHFVTVSGGTGSGKTRFLKRLDELGFLVLDLEGLANHRGSAFGSQLNTQPTQATFENMLGAALQRLEERPEFPIFVENESRSIGRCWLNEELSEMVSKSPRLELECPLEGRVQNIIEEYVGSDLEALRASNIERPLVALEANLQHSLNKISKRLGLERKTAIEQAMRDAFESHKRGALLDVHEGWVLPLLTQYYDSRYDHGREKFSPLQLCAGDTKVLEDFVLERYGSGREVT